jgi:hypothetical protein
LLGWHHAVTHGRTEEAQVLPASDPLAMIRVTPSMRATAKLGARWAMAAPLRYSSYAIDIVLLTAALMLSTMLRMYPFVYASIIAIARAHDPLGPFGLVLGSGG